MRYYAESETNRLTADIGSNAEESRYNQSLQCGGIFYQALTIPLVSSALQTQ